MRVSKILGSVVAVGVVAVALVSTTAGAAEPKDEDLVKVTCSGGEVLATGVSPWHTNAAAPWGWDKGAKVSVDEHVAKFKGGKCEGTIRAFICNGGSCKGPIAVPVK